MQSPEHSSRPRLPRIVVGLVALLAGLLGGALIAEAGLRVYARIGGPFAARFEAFDPFNVQVVPFGRVGYRQRPHARLRYNNGAVATANGSGYRGPDVALAKPPGVRRIVLLGGSTTHGWGVSDDSTIDAYMRRQLAASSRGRFEVINAALDGYDSRQLLERLQFDVLRLDPDVVIVNAGVNDVRNARFQDIVDGDPRTLIWYAEMERMRRQEAHGASLWTVAKHYSYLLRLPSFVRQARKSASLPTGAPVFMDAANYFEQNLRRIGRIAADSGFALILSTEPSSLRTRYAPDAPPEKTYWLDDAASTAVYRDTLDARLRKVAGDLARDGLRVRYLRQDLPPDQFLDDAHLTANGNAALAQVFTEAALRLLQP